MIGNLATAKQQLIITEIDIVKMDGIRLCDQNKTTNSFDKIRTVVSEVEPTSDKEEPKERYGVRSRANFGQGKAKKARWCPKSSQLRTRRSQKSEMVSEVKPTLDKAKPKERGGVRSQTNFRQGRAKRARWWIFHAVSTKKSSQQDFWYTKIYSWLPNGRDVIVFHVSC
ncbi:hypothetical protein J7E81_12675 [Bacillus sp. ISL-18]|uniref:hypothetical protein n=1 Tax=Bacillus sp. ISL-18 TaxID=2819118 RepID=UPI001BE8CC9E|nr:hypothetical protein [Bacillus sp. ISL-18]MBT2656070.1 hypothetical protein [Bacillus sp. ISL-18]